MGRALERDMKHWAATGAAGVVGCALAALAVGGCSGDGAGTGQADRAAVAADGAGGGEPGSVDDASAKLERMFEAMGGGDRRAGSGAGLGTSDDPWGRSGSRRVFAAPVVAANPEPVGPPAPTPADEAEHAAEGASSRAGGPDPVTAPPTRAQTGPSVEEVLSALAAERGAGSPVREAYRLALAEALAPGSVSAALESRRAALEPEDQARLDGFRELLGAFVSSGGASEELAGLLRAKADALAAETGLRLPTARLVRRVDGFGRFVPFEGSRFLAGRAQPVLVYVEVAGFAASERSGQGGGAGSGGGVGGGGDGPEWVIDLTQELRLYHDADGVLASHWRAQPARDVSRRKRTDHYLVQRITLPATLTVGAYNLKVIVRDLGGGTGESGGAAAEVVIPFQVVADPGLVDAKP